MNPRPSAFLMFIDYQSFLKLENEHGYFYSFETNNFQSLFLTGFCHDSLALSLLAVEDDSYSMQSRMVNDNTNILIDYAHNQY